MRKSRSYLRLVIATVVVSLGATARVDASTLQDFGSCLSREGAIFYGASWCPHCQAQRETLGAAMPRVRYVECSVNGERTSTRECERAGVQSYPTWVFADGSRASGEQSLASLAKKTGCELPSWNGPSAPRSY